MLHVDFETRSRVDLLRQGGHLYATDPSTEILMMSWAFDDEDVALWIPPKFDPKFRKGGKLYGKAVARMLPPRIREHVATGGEIAAFNAQFERLIMWYILCPDFGVPEPKLEQFYCVAAQARANNLPGNLDDCARILGAKNKKARRGKELIKLFCVPNGQGDFNDCDSHPDEWAEFCQYCIDDTYAEREVHQAMRPLTEAERDDYDTSEIINDRGLQIDRAMASAAVNYAEDEQADLIALIQQLTNGEVQKVRGQKITKWVYESLDEDMRRHMHVYKNDVLKLTFDRNARQRLLSEELPDIVAQVIEAADDAQAASTAKFTAMAWRADPEDDRVRGAYIFNGASASGRYSARGLQPHNLPRKVLKNVHEVREAMLAAESREELSVISGMNIMQTLKGLLRPAIMAKPGHTFVCGDWEQIEGRVNPWLSMGINKRIDRIARDKLDIYADPERDVYCETASDILHTKVTDREDPRRQGYGKVPELSLGFGGGKGAFMGMARNYGVSLPEREVEKIVRNWRSRNEWAVYFWDALFGAAVDACRNPGVAYQAGRVSYLYQPEFVHGSLWCLLPSGRVLCYPGARCEWTANKFGKMAWQLSAMKAAWKPKADETEWPRNYLWPGLLCENVTQAAAADVLRECLARMVLDLDWPVVGHVHDEALLEVPTQHAEIYKDELHTAMVAGADWTEGLPLAADIWVNDRYRK